MDPFRPWEEQAALELGLAGAPTTQVGRGMLVCVHVGVHVEVGRMRE